MNTLCKDNNPLYRFFLIFSIAQCLQLTNMTARTTSQSPSIPILAIKTVLTKVQGQLSMRSLTAAIRTHTLEGHPHPKDLLLGFFLNCQQKLKRGTQSEWNRVIEHEIRRMVGLQSIQRWILRRSFNAISQTIRWTCEPGDGLMMELESELGEMQISEEVHLKTKYFCQWLQFLQERREIRRLKNKQVQDVKKSRLFCHYWLKFQNFLQWKQQTRKAHTDREKAKLIQQKMNKRLTNSVFLAIKQIIDILTIEGQLANAVRARLGQLQVRSVFKNLRSNRENQQGKNTKKGNSIWLFRFFKYITQRIVPLQNLSSKNNREKLEENYQKISMQLCWKGFKAILHAKHARMNQIRNICKKKAVTDFIDIQNNKKLSKKRRTDLVRLRKRIFLKELVQNIEACNQSLKQHEQKIEEIQTIQIQSGIRQFLSILMQKTSIKKRIKTCTEFLINSSIKSSKKSIFRCLSAFKTKQIEYSSKKIKTEASVNAMLAHFRFKQFKSYKNKKKQLNQSLSKYHKKYLLSLVFKSFSVYKSISLNQYEALSNIFSYLRIKKLRETFTDLRIHSDLTAKLQKLIFRSEWVLLKVSFVTILNRILSKKMKIKACYHQQETKLKEKLFDLLKKNSEHMQEQREAVQRVSFEFFKVRFVRNLRKNVEKYRQQEQMQTIRKRICKKRFFSIFNQGKICRNQIEGKMQETALMLAANKMAWFTSSAKEFLFYRQNEDKLIYKLQKAIVRRVLKTIRMRMTQKRQQKEDRQDLQKEHVQKVRMIQSERTGRCLMALLRSKPSTLIEKTKKLSKIRLQPVLTVLDENLKEKTLKNGLIIARKTQFIDFLRAECSLSKNRRKFCKIINKQKAKRTICSLLRNTIDQADQRNQKTLLMQEWLEQSRGKASKKCLISKLSVASNLKENRVILSNTLLRNGFQRMLKRYLSRRSCAIKEIIALKLYATNLKRRTWRGLRRTGDIQVLKENNRARTEQHSKLISVQKSIEHVRRKSKLMETIERYNQSRLSIQKSIEHVRRKSKLMETIERYNQSRVSRVVR